MRYPFGSRVVSYPLHGVANYLWTEWQVIWQECDKLSIWRVTRWKSGELFTGGAGRYPFGEWWAIHLESGELSSWIFLRMHRWISSISWSVLYFRLFLSWCSWDECFWLRVNYPTVWFQNSEASNLLQKAVVSWDSLKLTVTSDHKLADTTRAFWEGANPRLAVSLLSTTCKLIATSPC